MSCIKFMQRGRYTRRQPPPAYEHTSDVSDPFNVILGSAAIYRIFIDELKNNLLINSFATTTTFKDYFNTFHNV